MFGDGYWVANRAEQQQKRYQQFLNHHQSKKIAIIECGAGLAVPTVRFESEAIDGTLIRINPRDSEVPNHRFNNREAISLALPALAALEQIAKIIERRKL
jgi:hypothetical protein